MSLFEWLRTSVSRDASTETGDTETVRRIVSELDKLEPQHARYIAAFAYILSRVAAADLHISEIETARMVQIVERVGALPESQALIVVEIAKSQNRLFGGTEDFLVTREFREISSDQQRSDLLECLFAVSAADDEVTGEEESQIWQIASELGFTHGEYVEVRSRYAGKRTVLRKPGI